MWSPVIHQIAVERAGQIVATVRSGESVPDAVTALWKDHHLQRFELMPFTKEQSVGLVESVLGGTLEGLSADVMWDASGGNPLFLRHMVGGAPAARALTAVIGRWPLPRRPGVPPAPRPLLADRLDHLGHDAV